jgi:transaldolase
MRPENLETRIFLDGGDPEETRKTISALGFLDGQTTNPTLISKNPQAHRRLEEGRKFDEKEIYEFYKKVVREISALIPQGSISIEVYADPKTKSEQMLAQGREMFSWIPNAHIKFPSSREGLQAAEQAVAHGLRINMTLCFTLSQAAAVYAATRGAQKGQVFVSPFVGRLDDREENGMDLITRILRLYGKGDGHVEVLTASVRTLDHLLYALKLGSHIITAPAKILKEWADEDLPIPDKNYQYDKGNLKEIPYQDLDLDRQWQDYDLVHELTTQGMEKFSKDWDSLVR